MELTPNISVIKAPREKSRLALFPSLGVFSGKYMKPCNKCSQIKPLAEFHKNGTTKDGHVGTCKACVSIHHKKYSQTEERRAFRKAYNRTEQRKMANRKSSSKYKKSEKGRESIRRFCLRHPEYKNATNAVMHAIEKGKLPKPELLKCKYCPKQAEQYHHWSYLPEHWLDVEPLCIECHIKLHKKIA